MDTWTPIWSQIVDSTLWEEELPVRVLFLTMLALRDPDDVVRMPVRRLCKKAHMPPEVVLPALKVLLEPDQKSMDEQLEEGRRLKEVDGGWFIINARYYRDELKRLQKRQYQADWIRRKRAEMKGKPLTGEGVAVKLMESGDVNGADAATSAALPEVVVPQGKNQGEKCDFSEGGIKSQVEEAVAEVEEFDENGEPF